MGKGDNTDGRSLRLALFDQTLHTIKLLRMLLDILHDADLTAEQKAAVRHWERALPELRQGEKFARQGRPAPKKQRSPAKTRASSA